MTDVQELPADPDSGPRAARPGRRPVIAGLGMTELGKVYGRSPAQFAAEAVRLAVADAGVGLADVDGLLTSSGVTGGVSVDLQRELGLTDLRLLTHMQAYGSTVGSMVQYASMAVASGLASVVACVFADSPLRPDRGSSAIYGTRHAGSGWWGLLGASGVVGANPMYALAARRHMERYGTTTEQLGHIAVAQRAWAGLNPAAWQILSAHSRAALPAGSITQSAQARSETPSASVRYEPTSGTARRIGSRRSTVWSTAVDRTSG